MTTEIEYWILKNHLLFAHLKHERLDELSKFTKYHRLVKNDIIYGSEKEIDKLYILSKGRIKISYCMSRNIEVVSEILKEDDIFGELTLHKSENINCEFAQVLSEEALIYSLDIAAFEEFIRVENKTANVYAKMVAEKLKVVTSKFAALFFKDVKSRVLNFFILHSRYEGTWSGDTVEIDMYLNHQDIANFTGSARQTVSTVINNLIKEKIIIYEGRKKVIIPDIKKLEFL